MQPGGVRGVDQPAVAVDQLQQRVHRGVELCDVLVHAGDDRTADDRLRIPQRDGPRSRDARRRWLDHGMPEEPAREPEPPPPLRPDVKLRTSMAAERTWLAWWRTALAATAGALAVGRLAPRCSTSRVAVLVLGCGYAVLAAGMLVQGARRQRELERAVVAERARAAPFRVVALFTSRPCWSR